MSVENTRNSILSIAKVYLGYQEGYNNDNIFGDWYGMPNQPWCAMFVSYCMSKAGVSQNVVKKFASCTIGWNWFAARGETRDKNFVPQRGDIIFFDWDPEAGNGIEHVGIVDRVENNIVYTVEGNHSDQVNEYNYLIGSSNIYGYAVPSFTGQESLSDTPTLIPSPGESTTTNYPTIARGSTGNYVKMAQQKLIEKGYPLSIYGADGIFGSETEQIVRNFQRDNNLVVDGIIGKNTWEKLGLTSNNMPSTYPGSVIGMGARGENVVKIQNELMRRGYEVSGGADGQYGSGVKAAVIQFQQDNGLDADGIVGKNTWDALFPQSGVGSTYPGFILTMGSRGAEVIAVQQKLMDLGYEVSGGADGQYGSGVRNAVRQFQSDNGLSVDGDVGPETWNALFPPTPVYLGYPGYLIAEGMSSYHVTLIQQRLANLGYSVGTIDGIFGTKTKNAVIQFQQNNGLSVDGIVGENTWGKLFSNSSTSTTTDENEAIYGMLEKLYSYAGDFDSNASLYEKNLLVLQYLRSNDYNGTGWDIIAKPINYNWIAFVENKNDPEINRNLKIKVSNSLSIGLPHLAVVMETNLLKHNDTGIVNDLITPATDLAGWAGDLVSFAASFYDDRTTHVLNSSILFSESYGCSLEDIYQDLDGFGMYYLLNFMKISLAFKIYYHDNKSTYSNRRFSNFVIDRIVNGPLFQGIDTSLSNQSKLEELSKKYLSADIASLAGVYGTAFLAFLSSQSGMNVNYDKTSYASAIANLFAQEIMLRAYNE